MNEVSQLTLHCDLRVALISVANCHQFTTRAGFCWWGPGANNPNIEDGSSLIIHWSSGSHKRSTNWANQYDIYFGGAPTGGGPGPWPPGPPKSGPVYNRHYDPSQSSQNIARYLVYKCYTSLWSLTYIRISVCDGLSLCLLVVEIS